MKTKYPVCILVVALVMTLGTACGGDEDSPSASPTSTATAERSATPASTATPPAATPTTAPPPTDTPPPTNTPPPPPPTNTPAPASPAVAVQRAPLSDRVILTFDAGSERGYAQRILEVLQAAGVSASFGITGQWAEQNADLVRRMSDEGHTLINHSYDHASFTGASWDHTALTFDERADQMHRAEAAIAAAAPGATTVPYFRPPFGDYNAGVLADAGALGYRYALMWAIDSGGWRGLSSAEVLQRVSAAQAGDIIIMHVGSQGDADALPAIIDQLRARGLGFATVREAFP